jgi:HAD superfamily hydrolase (TIGR01509 family)
MKLTDSSQAGHEPTSEQDDAEQGTSSAGPAGDNRPEIEALTADEKEAFLSRIRAEGRALTPEEREAIFGSRPVHAEPTIGPPPLVDEMEAAPLDAESIEHLQRNFFPELGDPNLLTAPPLVRGIVFDFDYTLAYLARPLEELMAAGAKNALAFMQAKGMDLADDFWINIVEARRFAEEKSEEEKEEHIADDAMSFLLQFFGYPASKMDPEVLKQAVDIFYAPEMSAWRLYPDTIPTLQALRSDGYQLALLTNYNCDRVFQRTVDYLGLRNYFDVVLSSASVEFRKPDIKYFQIVLEHWDLLPYEVVVVGDSLLTDIQGGVELGALTVHYQGDSPPQVQFDNSQAADQIHADASITTLVELPRLIAHWT